MTTLDAISLLSSLHTKLLPKVMRPDVILSEQDDIQEFDPPADRSNEVFKVSRNPDTYEITILSDKTLEDYRTLTRSRDWDLLLKYAEQMTGMSLVFVNPTMEGGGVAMLRPPLIHLLNQLGIEARWFVMESDKQVFRVTKKIHNIMQDRLDSEERLTREDRNMHWIWNEQNAKVLLGQSAVLNADILLIDDPQPAPLITLLRPYLKEGHNIIWRNHIHTDNKLMSSPKTAQAEVSEYLLDVCGIRDVDASITHPVESFMLPGMENRTIFAPATIDPFDDLNRKLSPAEVNEGIDFINNEISKKNAQLISLGRNEDVISPIDTSRNRILLIARFDESKGMDHAMKLGKLVRDKMRSQGYRGRKLPQLILVGNGSVDDPSGVPMYEKMLMLRREKYKDDKEDFVIMRLRHNYMAMNALMYSSNDVPVVGIQLSEKEGCETRISDEIEHGIPVVVFNNGGMPLQVIEGKSGYVLDYDKPDHDLKRGATIIAELFSNPDKYAHLRQTTREAGQTFNSVNFGTVSNVIRVLRTMDAVTNNQQIDQLWGLDDIVLTT